MSSENRYAPWFRRAVWLGIIQDWALGIPAIFAPEKALKLLNQRPTRDPIWTSFASLMTVLVSLFYIPAAQDPIKNQTTAVLTVLARPPGVAMFLVFRRGLYPLLGYIDGFMTAIQVPLLFLTLRAERRRRHASAGGSEDGDDAPSGLAMRAPRREIEREALFAYDGSTFEEVRSAAFSGAYAELPHHRGAGWRTLLRFFNDSARNLIDRRDVLPRFDKLIHANGITLTGVWRIDTDSPYTGYFARGSEGLLLARASIAGPQIDAGKRRTLGIAGKVFPTMDPGQKVKPGNFVTNSDLSGQRRRHVTDYATTNHPKVGLSPVALITNKVIFRLMDTRPGWRQLYPISTLGLGPDDMVRTPDLMRLRTADGTPKVDARDFRDELRLERYPGGRLTYLIEVKDFDDAQWRRIGAIEFDDYAIAEGGDKRIHFWIPRDVPSRP
jgi:hypothetical protein